MGIESRSPGPVSSHEIFPYVHGLMAFSSSVMSMSLSGTENVAPETAVEDGDSEADWLNLLSQNRFEKRKFAANDPRSLFASVYANYHKRGNDPRDLFKSMYANYYGAGNGAGYRKRYNTQPNIESYYQAPPPPAPVVGSKRGFKNPQDPRNLFRAVYGWKK